MDAWDISEEMIKHAGPLDSAYMHLGSRVNLNSPDFVEIRFIDNQTKRPRKAWMLPCRIAFVEQGAAVPELTFDKDAKEYINHWFPPHIRVSDAFAGIKYAQIQYKGPCQCMFATRVRIRSCLLISLM